MVNEKNYNIGLDIGVGSVGWCVTDENNNLLKKGGKNMWGSRLFSEAETAKKRREFRSNRRRLERRKERIIYLQEIFNDEINKEYPNFFPMLKESSNVSEDKMVSEAIDGIKYNLFADENFNDKDFFHNFKTIYHLRNYLCNTKQKEDIRLIYLALHHIIKYRGNFLHEENFSDNISNVEDDIESVIDFLEKEYDVTTKVETKKIIELLQDDKTSKANKRDEFSKLFDSDSRSIITNVIKAWLGYKFDISKIFDIEFDKNTISFSNEIEDEDKIIDSLQENADIYESMKNIYSWITLQNILKGKKYISEAFIAKYDKYKNDLFILKDIYKRYYSNEYNDFFRKERTNNYVHYNKKKLSPKTGKFEEEKFFNEIKNKIKMLPDDYNPPKNETNQYYKDKKSILDAIESNDFLRKINVTDNGAVPRQLHQKELEKIINNQKEYYPFLADNKEKIIKIFETRIPYYVGPLARNENQSKWSWVIRNENEPIRPWNMHIDDNNENTANDVYDKDATAEKFITRLTNRCTYLLEEPVMPKQSILYSRYCVLNELNKIRINNHYLSKDKKKEIINELFEKNTKVGKKDLEKIYKKDGFEKIEVEGLSDGVNFNSNMKSYIDMCKIFGNVNESNINKCEKIIYYITIFEDKKIRKRKIKQLGVNDEQLNKIMKLKYTGWSAISKKLLTGIKANDGENIMQKLESTNMNFMQIINKEEFGFNEELKKYMPKKHENIEYEDVENIPTSPANKRAIWQTIKIVSEIENIMKSKPKNIYLEFARGEDEKKALKDSRIKYLLKIYENIEKQGNSLKNYDPEVYKELKQKQNDKEITDKMFLYCIQNGKSLYSGKPLHNLDECEIDHIVPRSLKFIDEMDNKALVFKQENQEKKDSLVLPDKWINANIAWWKSLVDNKLISSKKFYRLIRRKEIETEEECKNFVGRQLNETRQITKYVANLLKTPETSVWALRAQLTHDFRMKYHLYKNRGVNDCHHAQDAYIISTIGNLLDKEWKGIKNFEYGEYLKYEKDRKSKKEKYGIIMGFINKRVNINQINEAMNSKSYFITRMLEEQTGEFYNQTIQKAGVGNIQLKNGRDVKKYGGYTSENISYAVIYTYIDSNGKRQYQLTGIPIKIATDINNKKETLKNYIQNCILINKEYSEFKILRKKILKNQEYLNEYNEPIRLCSDKEIRTAKQLIIDQKWSRIVYLMNRNEKALTDKEKEDVKNSYQDLYEYLLEKMKKEYKTYKNSYDRILKNKEEFINLDDDRKKAVINGIISIMATGQGNLKDIKLGERQGRMSGNNFKTDKLLNMTFLDKSVTGMHERRYKVNGMENGSNK